jgi:hypothetical protein
LSEALLGATQIAAQRLAETTAVDLTVTVEGTGALAGALEPIPASVAIGARRGVPAEKFEFDERALKGLSILGGRNHTMPMVNWNPRNVTSFVTLESNIRTRLKTNILI